MPRRNILLAVLFCLLTAAAGWSQDARGTILGKVSDPSGALIPGAQVVVTNVAMGTKSVVTTNAEGYYLAPLLMPGTYQVEASAAGFKKAMRSDIEVRISDRLDISFALEIGASDQTVTVTGEAPLLNSETASSGTIIDSRRVASLPLSYGNPFLLIGLTAGVTFNGSVRLDRPFEPTHIVNFSMGGTRGNLNDITIDGAPTTATANANEVTAAYVPPTDIVQEFKVQTATFDAQFGQTQGGVTNISIKSGTNHLHGTARYQFYRPSLWANDCFNNFAPAKTPFAWIPGADRSAVRSTSPRSTTEGTRPSSCGDTRGFTMDVRGTTTPPTPCRPRRCRTAISPRCWPPARSTRSTTLQRAPARHSAGRYTKTPFPGNIIPSRGSIRWAPRFSRTFRSEKSRGDAVGLTTCGFQRHGTREVLQPDLACRPQRHRTAAHFRPHCTSPQ